MNEFNNLCKFIQINGFNVVLVEGPRGVGKTTFCNNLLESSDLVYYKTWGTEQRDLRHDMQSRLNLELPQGTYFVLDFVSQVKLSHPVLADRGNLSALAYQRELPYGTNNELHRYYVDLMRRSRSVLLYLEGPEDVLLRRRVRRKDKDEFRLYQMSEPTARRKVQTDVAVYEEAIDKMEKAGLVEVSIFELDEGCSCYCYVANGLDVQHIPEKINEY